MVALVSQLQLMTSEEQQQKRRFIHGDVKRFHFFAIKLLLIL